MGRRRSWRTTAAALVLAAVVAGCGSPNGGRQTAADFEAWLADHPYEGLSVAEVSTTEALPFVGAADITLRLAGDAVDSDTVTGAMDHVCPFRPGGSNAATFQLRARRVTVPVDCTDTAAPVEVWDGLRSLPGLGEASYGEGQLVAVFTRSGPARSALVRLRDEAATGRWGVDRITLAVGDRWLLWEDTDVSARARAAIDDALGSGVPLDRLQASSLPDGGETVTVIVRFGPRTARDLRRSLLAGHPERAGLVHVLPSPDR